MEYSRDSGAVFNKKVAKVVINSKEAAEVFIKGYMRKHSVDRKMAELRLRQLGVKLESLPGKV